MQAFHIQLTFVEVTIAIIETCFSSPETFNFCASQHESCYVLVFKKKFVICLPVADFQTYVLFAKVR